MDSGLGASTEVAIAFESVSKRYRLAGSPRQLLFEAAGLSRFFGGKGQAEDFFALDEVTFAVSRGQRVGLIGRNGAGKTTLLKLIAGNYRATSGSVRVNGSVQALMTLGQGFHPDYSGRDNIRASLQYNGLSDSELKVAFEDVVEFCELGPFLDLPFKTYSSGMQSRLMFATATAIRPEVLIIDEVLGAGDAYFLAKSKRRVEALVATGCTLLLVSHAMSQVLELCDRVIWLDGGRVRASGQAFPIVKAYEEAMYGAMPGTGDPLASRRRNKAATPTAEPMVAPTPPAPASPRAVTPSRSFLMQQPVFRPHGEEVGPSLVPDSDGRELRNVAPGGISRWAGTGGLIVVGASISGPRGPTSRLICLQPARVTLFLEAQEVGEYSCTYGLAVHDLQGRCVARMYSPPDRFFAKPREGRRVEMILNPLQIGPGVYTVGVSVLHETAIENANQAERYDLLSRSFAVEVALPDSLGALTADFIHSSEWEFRPAVLPASHKDGI